MGLTNVQNKRYALDRKSLGGGILYNHHSQVNVVKFQKRWKNFKPSEFACRRTGQFYYHPPTFDCCQRARDDIGKALSINSGHRSRIHNALVGGAPQSAHLLIAVDISTRGHNRAALLRVLIKAGFKSFGLYNTFIHADLRPDRMWFGSQSAKALWTPIVNRINQERIQSNMAAAA